MFTIHAFASTTAANSSLTNLAAATDPVAAISGNFLYVPVLNQLIGAYAIGPTILRAQLSAPSLLTDVPYDVTPVDAATDPASPLPILMHPQDPIALVTNEPLQCLRTNTNAEQGNVFVFLADGALSKVSGRILRVRATVTTGTTPNSWTNNAITLTNQLAEGTYNLVGARVEATHGFAFRFVFPGGTNATRPGGICVGTASKFDPFHTHRNGNLGVWGTFSNRVLPTMDFMTDGTSETATVIMDLIKQ